MKSGTSFLKPQWEFYLFLFIGCVMLMPCCLFLYSGEYKLALPCFLVAIACPGLMPADRYAIPLASHVRFIRFFAKYGSQLTNACRFLCLLAILLMAMFLKN